MIIPTHKTLPDTASYGHPANTITVIAHNGITSNNVQKVLEDLTYTTSNKFSANGGVIYGDVSVKGDFVISSSANTGFVNITIENTNKNVTYTLPTEIPSEGYVLSSTLEGNLSWKPNFSLLNNLTIISEDYTITDNNFFIGANGIINITMPSSIGIEGRAYQIKNIGNGPVTILPFGSEDIDGNSDIILSEKNSTIGLISSNSNWLIF